MSFRPIIKVDLAKKYLYEIANWRVQEKINDLKETIDKKEKIIDIGSGNCIVAANLKESKYEIDAVDINNNSLTDKIKPILYDGKKLPFKDNSFDVALLITVLHHTDNPEKVLKEAMRVSRKVVILEEIYTNVWDKYLTYFIDSLFNFEFINHPHSNKTDKGWKRLFKKLGAKSVESKYSKSFFVLKRALYQVNK